MRRYDDALKIKEDLDNFIKQYEEMNERVRINVERVATAQSTALQATDRVERAMGELSALLQNQKTIIAELKSNKVIPSSVEPVRPPSPVTYTPQSTIYFQFAGFTREEAVAISNDIVKAGWKIPGQERTPVAVNTNQIRFNAADKETAKRLKEDADTALQQRGINIALTLQENAKVKPGIPEI